MDDIQAMPPRKQEIYDTIAAQSDWLTRAQLADLTGKRKLSTNDIHHLDRLVEEDRIEVRDNGVPGRPLFQYRLRKPEQ